MQPLNITPNGLRDRPLLFGDVAELADAIEKQEMQTLTWNEPSIKHVPGRSLKARFRVTHRN